jgi:Tol biopolymer transport system component/DNA-binding winged helix-turn-helix (wHTH) protein
MEYRFGDYHLSVSERVLRRNGEIVPLPLKSLEVLLVLVEQHGQVVSKEELMAQVWSNTHVEEANLARHIYTLRKTLGENTRESGGEQPYILTVSGRGYRFVKDVQTQDLNTGVEQAPAQPGGRSTNRILIAFIALFTMMLVAAIVIIGVRARGGHQPPPMIFRELTSTVNVLEASITPDGKYIVMKVDENGKRSLYVRSLVDGTQQQILPPSSPSLGGVTISPDSKFVYYNAKTEGKENEYTATLYQVRILGGEVRKIKEGLSGPVTFAPDNDRFAFIREDRQRRRSSLLLSSLTDPAETELIERETPAEYLDYPAWSPDGSRIVCTLNTETGDSHLLEVTLSDGVEHRLLTPPSWRYILRPVWVKDGSGLIVTVKEGFNRCHAWFLPFPPNSENPPWRLANGSIVHPFGVSVTDDGGDMVIMQQARIANVWVASAATSEDARQITSSGGHYEGLSWTPDGQLLFASDANNFWDIWRMQADGGDQRSLTTNAYDNIRPSMSPDGCYIFFTSNRSGAYEIWRIDADGGNPKQMTFDGRNFAPQCLPDRKWVVFTSSDGDGAFALRKVPVEGGEPVTLFQGNMEDAVISPDGKYIACLMAIGPYSRSIRPARLTLISLADGKIIRHFADIGFRVKDNGNNRLGWMHDGSGIVYIDRQGASDDLLVQPLAGGQPRRQKKFCNDRIYGFAIARAGKLAVLCGPIKYNIVRVSNPNIKPGRR